MRRYLAAAYALVFAGLLCLAQSSQAGDLSLLGAGKRPAGGAASFSGVADVVASPTVCYSLRACSAAIAAAGTQKLANIRRSSDSHTCDIIVATGGGMGNTANCSTGGDNGASVSSFCNATSCFAGTWYDQGSAGLDVVQATSGNQPQLLLTGCSSGSLPCLSFNGSTQWLENSTGLASTLAQPNSYSMVAIRTGNFTSFGALFDIGGGPRIENRYNNATDTFFIFSGGGGSATVTDSVWHLIQVLYNTTTSVVNADGTETTGISAGSSDPSAGDSIVIGARSGGGSLLFTGKLAEAVFYGTVGFNGTQRTNLCHNQFGYWGTPTSC